MNQAFPRKSFRWALILAIAVMAVIMIWDTHLTTSVSPRGIVSFELAGTAGKARHILDAWDETAKVFAGLSLGIDYLFMLLYAAVFYLAVSYTARRVPYDPLKKTGIILAPLMIVAALADAVENYALIRVLTRGTDDFYPALARTMALIKFGLLGLGLLYLLAGLPFLDRKTSPASSPEQKDRL